MVVVGATAELGKVNTARSRVGASASAGTGAQGLCLGMSDPNRFFQMLLGSQNNYATPKPYLRQV